MAIDIICGLVALYGFWQGYNRGIVGTVFNLLAYGLGLVVALKVTPITTQLLETAFKSDNPLMFIAGFLVNIFVIVFILKQAANGIEGVLNFAYLGMINQLLGSASTAGLFVLIYSVIVWFGVKSSVLAAPLIADSRTYKPLLEPLPPRAKEFAVRLKPLAEEGWKVFSVWLDKVDQYKEKTGTGIDTSAPKPSHDSSRKVYDLPEDDGIERNPER